MSYVIVLAGHTYNVTAPNAQAARRILAANLLADRLLAHLA